MKQRLLGCRAFMVMLMVMLTGSMWAANSFTLTFKDGPKTDSDGGTALTTESLIDSIKNESGFKFSCSAVSNVYPARVSYGCKLGASSKTGSFTLNFESAKYDSVVVNCCSYSTSEGKIKINSGDEIDLTDGGTSNKVLRNVKYIPSGNIESLTIETTAKRAYVKSITFYPNADAKSYTFIATDKNGKGVNSKFAASPLTVKFGEYVDGMTFKVNGADATYAAETGLTISAKTGSKANDKFAIVVYDANGDSLTTKSYTWIPTFTAVSNLKQSEDGTEAILSMSNANVTYVSSDQKNVYIQDASRGILAYNLGITGFEAYKQTAVSIWGKKDTYKTGVVQFQACDSTATNAMVTASAVAVKPTAKTVAQSKLADNQLTYIKMSGAKIVKEGSNYYAVAGADSVMLYDSFKTGALTALETVPVFADVTGIVSIYNTTVEVFPTAALENVSDKITGESGTVTWTIDMDGNMVFAPTTGESGTLAQTGTAASKRPWDAVKTAVKTVKFEAGVVAVSDNSYMFKEMANLESVDFTNFNTSAQTTMKGMFNGCSSLKSVDMSMLDLAKVTNFNLTFNGCTALESVNFGDNTLAAVTNFNSMFYSCKALKSLDFSKVTGDYVTNMASMLYDCIALETVDFRAFSTANVSSAINAKNVFGTGDYAAMPKTLIISKKFGKIAVADTYIALPAKTYYNEAGTSYNLADETAQASLYKYNEALADYGTYIDTVPTAINAVNVNANANANSGKFMQNGRLVIVKNGKQYNAAGAQLNW